MELAPRIARETQQLVLNIKEAKVKHQRPTKEEFHQVTDPTTPQIHQYSLTSNQVTTILNQLIP
jgi:hypothetical protein